MKQILPLIISGILFAACSEKKETASSIAQKWCDLNSKVAKAQSAEEMASARAALNKYENEIDEKYRGDEKMRTELEKEIEKCEDASEGRN